MKFSDALLKGSKEYPIQIAGTMFRQREDGCVGACALGWLYWGMTEDDPQFKDHVNRDKSVIPNSYVHPFENDYPEMLQFMPNVRFKLEGQKVPSPISDDNGAFTGFFGLVVRLNDTRNWSAAEFYQWLKKLEEEGYIYYE